MRQLQAIQPVQDGYYLEPTPYDGFLSVILPEPGENLILNPIMDGDSDTPSDWVHSSVSDVTQLTESPFWERYNRYVVSGYVAAKASGTIQGKYTASVWVKSPEEAQFKIGVSYSSVTVESSTLISSTVWQQYSITFSTNGAVGSSVQVRLMSLDGKPIDIAAMQLEKKEYPTTLMHGYAGEGYKWLGTPFKSISRRAGDVLDGGRKVNLKQLGMRLTSIEGLGIPDIDHVTTPLAFQYGSLFTCITIKSRDYDMDFTLHTLSLKDLLCARNAVGRAIFSINQPRCFVWQPLDCGVPICDESYFTAVYSGGFSQELTSHYGEEISLSFTGYDVAIKQAANSTKVLNGQVVEEHIATVGVDENGNIVLLPSFSSISSTIYAVTQTVVSPFDGNLYVTVSEGGLPPLRGMLLRYDGTSWTQIARTDYGGLMSALHAHGQYIYVGTTGQEPVIAASGFTGTSGNGFASINLATQVVEDVGDIDNATVTAADGSTVLQPQVRAITTDKTGNVYVGGYFTGFSNGSSSTATGHVAIYDRVSGKWVDTNIGLGLGIGGVRALLFEDDTRRLYIGGDFRSSVDPSLISTQNVFSMVEYKAGILGGGVPTRIDFPVQSGGVPGEINSIVKYRNRIVVGGHFRSSFGYDQDLLDNVAYYDPDMFSGMNVKGGLMPLGGRGQGWGIDSTFAEDTCDDVSTPDQLDCNVEPVETMTVCDDILYIGGKFTTYGIRETSLYQRPIGSACGSVKYVSTAEHAETGFMTADLDFSMITAFPYTNCYMTHVSCGSEKLGVKRFYSSNVLYASEFSVLSQFTAPTQVTLCDTDLPTEPSFFITGPGKLTEISNQTIGASLYFDYTISANETIEVDLTTTPAKVTSTLFGDVTYMMLPASTPGSFKLYPGTNQIIARFTNDTTTSDTKSLLIYKRKALSAETLCCDCQEFGVEVESEDEGTWSP